MKKCIIIFLCVFLTHILLAQQTEEAKKKIGEGVASYYKKDYNVAIINYQEAIKLDPSLKEKGMKNIAKCYDALGFNYEKSTNVNMAEKHYLQAIRNDSSNKDYYLHLASLYSSTGDNYNAIKLYEKAIQLGADTNIYSKEIERLKMKKSQTDDSENKAICPNCKNNIPEEANFCPYCQHNLKIKSYQEKRYYKNQEEIYEKEIIYNEDKEFRKIELSLFYGFIGGAESPLIGWTSTGKEIKIRTGGKGDVGLAINYYLNPYMKIISSFGYSWGALNMKVQNVDGGLSKLPLRTGLLFQFKLGPFLNSMYYFHFGPGVSIYFNPTIYQKWSGYNYSSSITYNTALGFDGNIGFTYYSQKNNWLIGYIDFRYHYVHYSMDEGEENGRKLVPGNTKPEWREMDGTHFGIYVGIGVRF